MKVYPPNWDTLIGFDLIANTLSKLCKTSFAKQRCSRLKPLSNPELIRLYLSQTREASQLFKAVSMPNLENLDLIKPDLQGASKEGVLPDVEFLFALKKLLEDTTLFYNFFTDVAPSFPQLNNLLQKTAVPVPLFEFLMEILDEEGTIHPDATPELAAIVRQILRKEKEVRSILHHKFEWAKQNGWAGETEITIRNERLVMPIIAEHKRKIQGLVHDESATGKYLYIEPLECLEENNRLRELYINKRKEIQRILKKANGLLMQFQSDLETLFQILETLDFVQAKAQLANQLNAQYPQIAEEPGVYLHNAVHPHLILRPQSQGEPVPNSIELNAKQSVLLISGPNAGGKSVLLKTTLILQAMFQSGIPITASASSQMYVFDQILVDISDSQSLENELSTYSAHLSLMQFMLGHAHARTLFAIDEAGAGTDPELAVPITRAIIEALVSSRALGLITTHLGQLKKIPEYMSQVANASMQYDPTHMKPLFTLRVGRPGHSFAFELAQHYLPQEVLNKAHEYTQNQDSFDYKNKMMELDKLEQSTLQEREKLLREQEHLQRLISEYKELRKWVQGQKNEQIVSGKKKAREIVREAELLLLQAKKSKSTLKANPKVIQDQIQVMHNQLSQTTEEEEAFPEPNLHNARPVVWDEIQVGQRLLLKEGGQWVEVVELKKDKAKVLMGQIFAWVKASQLWIPDTGQKKKKNKKPK